MSVSSDIVQGWCRPGTVMRRHLQRPVSEPFAFSLLLAFLVLAFVSLWPWMSRLSLLQPEVPMLQRLVAAGLALLASIPLWYLLAALSQLASKALGGRGTFYSARLALFASLLSASPAMLLQGLVAGMVGPGLQLDIVGAAVASGFLYLWISMLIEAKVQP